MAFILKQGAEGISASSKKTFNGLGRLSVYKSEIRCQPIFLAS